MCFSIGWGDFTHWLQSIGFFELPGGNTSLKLSDMDLLFVQANAPTPGLKRLDRKPDRSLARHNFLEAVVRLARSKYMCGELECCLVGSVALLTLWRARDATDDRVETFADAIKLFVKEVFVDNPKCEYDRGGTKWRKEELWVREVDDVMRQYLDAINDVYEARSAAESHLGASRVHARSLL